MLLRYLSKTHLVQRAVLTQANQMLLESTEKGCERSSIFPLISWSNNYTDADKDLAQLASIHIVIPVNQSKSLLKQSRWDHYLDIVLNIQLGIALKKYFLAQLH